MDGGEGGNAYRGRGGKLDEGGRAEMSEGREAVSLRIA